MTARTELWIQSYIVPWILFGVFTSCNVIAIFGIVECVKDNKRWAVIGLGIAILFSFYYMAQTFRTGVRWRREYRKIWYPDEGK